MEHEQFETNNSNKKHLKKKVILGLILASVGVWYLLSSERQISIFGNAASPLPGSKDDPEYLMPEKEENRIDFLILGMRGSNDPDASSGGPLLTDSIQILSFDKLTKNTSIISLPRDLYVVIDGEKKDKLNVVYEYGLSHKTNSLKFTKEKFSQISGIYIDEVVVFDFSSFKDLVDALGGIDITLTTPFKETQQWGYEFYLPAGKSHLDGQSALYYARSRYSSDDFDRSKRQQKIILAIKDKLLQLDFMSDPVKSFSILNMIRNDVRTEIGIWNIREYMDLANNIEFDNVKHSVISTENLLVEGRQNGAYILLPKTGNLSEIKQFFKDSLN